MPLIKGKSNTSLQKNIETEMRAHPEPSRRKQNLAIAYNLQRRARKKMASGGESSDTLGEAIGYPKKMAKGGEVEISAKLEKRPMPSDLSASRSEAMRPKRMHNDPAHIESEYGKRQSPHEIQEQLLRKKLADGGEISTHEDELENARELEMLRKEHDRDTHLGPDYEDSKEVSTHYDEEMADEDHQSDREHMAGMYDEGGMLEDDAERPHSLAQAIMKKRKKLADGGTVDIQENGREEGSNPYDHMNADAVLKELYDDSQLDDQPLDSNEHSDDIEKDRYDMIDSIRAKIKRKMR